MTRWIIVATVIVFGFGAFENLAAPSNRQDYDGHPHQWFAWHPVRLQGGKPIPTVQEGGHIVWLKTIERVRFFGRWVYREIGDKRELTR